MDNYFCGWYFKCQYGHQTLAVIPALHIANGEKTCSIQLITEERSWNIPFFIESLGIKKNPFSLKIGQNIFSENGIKLNLKADDLNVNGSVRFSDLHPLHYDIMGPFRFVPFMECRHSVISMMHAVNGRICINGTDYQYKNGIGYIEGDRGTSFPKKYAWTQCSFEEGSLMISAADIPIGRFHFTGVISAIRWQKKEYRLATYLGAKAEKIKDNELVIRQGRYELTAKLLNKNAHALKAPAAGAMTRTIHENPSCRVHYCFSHNGRILFSFTSNRASFEYEYPV